MSELSGSQANTVGLAESHTVVVNVELSVAYKAVDRKGNSNEDCGKVEPEGILITNSGKCDCIGTEKGIELLGKLGLSVP